MMDDDAWRVIERLPRGARSRAVNAAIREWSSAAARRDAAARMDALRAGLPPVAMADVVRWVREEQPRQPQQPRQPPQRAPVLLPDQPRQQKPPSPHNRVST